MKVHLGYHETFLVDEAQKPAEREAKLRACASDVPLQAPADSLLVKLIFNRTGH